MFNGKREKELEERLAAQHRRMIYNKEAAGKQVAGLTAARVRIERNLDHIAQKLDQTTKLAQENKQASDEVHTAVVGVNNAVESFGATHSVFVGQMKNQNEKMGEFLAQQREVQTPVQAVSQTQANLVQMQEEMLSGAQMMTDYAKSMSVLALNAAIEAGRLGESGKGFLHAAEEIRAYAEKYELSAKSICEQLAASKAQMEEIGQQTAQLNQALRETVIAAGKIYSSGMQTVAAYESGQIDLRENLAQNAVSGADQIKQSGEEMAVLAEEMAQQIEEAHKEINEQVVCTDELEKLYRENIRS